MLEANPSLVDKTKIEGNNAIAKVVYINCFKIMRIRELIEQLERIEKIVEDSPHPDTDMIRFAISFDDRSLDSKDWNVEIDEITFDNRLGCWCEEKCVIQLSIKEEAA